MSIKNYKEFPIAKIVKAKWNYKTDDEEKIVKLIANMKKNGQIENLIVRPIAGGKYEAVNGNHRLEALQRMKVKKIVGYDMGKISLSMAKRIAIETNETSFDTDSLKLSKIFKELLKEYSIDDLASTVDFSVEDIDQFVKIDDMDFQHFDGDVGLKNNDDGFLRFIITVPSGKEVEKMRAALKPLLEKHPSATLKEA